ncbi:MAG TPA: phosphoenolpyruvate carboxykinase (GTP) [Planctomycetota bacterium]|nr:phosphoenolpyruvate carboxykinase (GTP) [Planctomycetota bacterium]
MPSLSPPRPLAEWVEEVARSTRPAAVVWCDGSDEEARRLVEQMSADGTLRPLDAAAFPGCYLHRSHPSDVARSEHLTFICTERAEDAGPTNNWMSPAEAEQRVRPLFEGAMQGRTMYVVPYLLGPAGSPYARAGVEVTDSPYVALSLRIMTRVGGPALERIAATGDFVRGLHSLGDLDPKRRFVCHFPERKTIWSIGSGYGGNALLPKKCHALRIASWVASREGWLAEHMLIVGIEEPSGETSYVAAAFPSASGKTNLAMLVPPESYKGWKIRTVGDDIAWLNWGADGRLYAVNPEAGFFAVAPGTSEKTNANMMATVRRDTIFTNVAVTPDNRPWWEGMGPPPAEALDWQGRPWKPGGPDKAAHPNSRFTTPARNCPVISPLWEEPAGVPISAILFGGRRAKVVPLAVEAFDWRHGVFMGASMGSETTAAAVGQVGVVRRDPMAMLPFCGYNMGDYFRHWLEMGKRSDEAPGLFQVNWFRTGADGSYLWPGFGDNLRVLKWILDRVRGRVGAVRTPVGYVPSADDLDLRGLPAPRERVEAALRVDPAEWEPELAEMEAFFQKFGDRLPQELWAELTSLKARLGFPVPDDK